MFNPYNVYVAMRFSGRSIPYSLFCTALCVILLPYSKYKEWEYDRKQKDDGFGKFKDRE
jgi:hypothetical protein